MLNTGWGKKNKGRAEGVAGREGRVGRGHWKSWIRLCPGRASVSLRPGKALRGWAMSSERGHGATSSARELGGLRGARGAAAPHPAPRVCAGAAVTPRGCRGTAAPPACPRPPTPGSAACVPVTRHPRPPTATCAPHLSPPRTPGHPKSAVTPRVPPAAAPGHGRRSPRWGQGATSLSRSRARRWRRNSAPGLLQPDRVTASPCPQHLLSPSSPRASPSRSVGTWPRRRRRSAAAPVSRAGERGPYLAVPGGCRGSGRAAAGMRGQHREPRRG